jgi:hypothetical protein
MMPPTATLEAIKAHQQRVEKNKITPDNLPPCPRCRVESAFFKIHAYRERRFLIIIEMFIKAACCSLVRFGCPGCGKTFTHYPDFAIAHKHYTRQTIEGFSRAYVENDQRTYEDAVMTDDGVPEHAVSGRMLSPSSVHRWIGTLAELIRANQDVMKKWLSERGAAKFFEDSARIQLSEKKYKTPKRRHSLLSCRWFFNTAALLRKPDFTEFAITSV